MGCGASVPHPALPSPTYASETLPTIPISHSMDDKSPNEIEFELNSLKKQTFALTSENEKLKHEINRDMSKLFPQVFNSADSQDDLIEEWLGLDLYEGDKQVEFLEVLFPQGSSIIEGVKLYSSSNKSKETSLKEYFTYFKHRFEEGDKVLNMMGQEKSAIDACVQSMKARFVTSIKQFESLFGKKSPEIDHITSIFGEVQSKPMGVPFLTGLQSFYEKALAFHISHYEAKLQAAAEAQTALKSEHFRLFSETKQQHKEEIDLRDDTAERNLKLWNNLLWKQTDELAALRHAFRIDLDNQLLHFDEHCRRLKEECGADKEKMKGELEDVIRELEGKIAVFEQEMVVKAAAENRCVELQQEIDRLLDVQKSLENQLSDAKGEVQSQSDRITELESSIVVEAEHQKRTKKQACTIRFMSRYGARLRLEKTAVMLVWNTVAMQDQLANNGYPAPRPPYPLNIEDAMNEDAYPADEEEFADGVLLNRAQTTLKFSELSEMYAITAQKDKPMTSQQVIKIFEEMMSRKYESDISEIRNERLPKSIPMFLYDHLFRSVGLKPLAIKALNQFIPGLQQLYNEGDQYGLLICRLLQMFHQDPVHYLMGLYLTEILVQFEPLTEKCSKTKVDRQNKRNAKQAAMASPRGKKGQSDSSLGGSAFLRDVLLLVYSHFENERNVGERLIKLLQPDELSLDDYVIFLICQRMAKLGKSSDAVFKVVDPMGTGAVGEGEFVMRIREALDLWLPEVSLRMFFRNISGSEKRISQSVFLSKINLTGFSSNCTSEQYTISTCHFLLSLIQVFKDRERRFILSTNKFLHEQEIKQIAMTDFDSLVQMMDPMLTSSEIADLWTLAVHENTSGAVLTTDQFLGVILAHPIGALKDSVFCKPYTDNKEIVQLLLSPSAASPNPSTTESSSTDPPATRTARAKSAYS